MKIIVVGGAGYLGGILCSLLLSQNHQVIVYDKLFFGDAALKPLYKHPNFKFISGDIRDIQAVHQALKGQEAVVLLAALVGEPACNRDPDKTVAINYLATTNLMKAALYHEVPRIVFTSTDSCYGAQEGVLLNEESPLEPISLYAELKVRAEEDFLRLYQDSNLCSTILRLATLYGLAPRMRFDLVINLLTREATLQGTAKIFSGEQWRPLVHVRDAALAFSLALEAPESVVRQQVYNVGSNDQNVQFKDLGLLLHKSIPKVHIQTIPQPPDLRDYHVVFDKIQKELNFNPKLRPKDGILEIKEALTQQKLGDPYDTIYQNG